MHYVPFKKLPEVWNINDLVHYDILPDELHLEDSLDGFDSKYNNELLDFLNRQNQTIKVHWQQQVVQAVKNRYPNLLFEYDHEQKYHLVFKWFENFREPPKLDFEYFVCSFNRVAHVGRKLLVAALDKQQLWNNITCSKNFTYTTDELDGHITELSSNPTIDLKFFLGQDSFLFGNSIISHNPSVFEHSKNINFLAPRIARSFVHIVSECNATSYQPYITEKFLYSVVCKGLFIGYAQPGWHQHLYQRYGFRRYEKLFDYTFDNILNPVERLIALLTMLSRYRHLSHYDWHDLYMIEKDTVDYNYEHYHSKNYRKYMIKSWE